MIVFHDTMHGGSAMKINYLLTALFGGLLLVVTSVNTVHAMDQEEEQRYIDFDKETPSGTVQLEGKQVAFIVGGGWGSGVLNFKGKDYPFKITGLKAGGIGYVKLDAVGEVYFLNKLEDFAGKYGAGSLGATAVKGSIWSTVENNQGVIMRLKAKSEGVALNLGAGGISIKFEE